jgi:hypothetical protein
MSAETPVDATHDAGLAVRVRRSTPHPVMVCPSSSTEDRNRRHARQN